MTIAEFCTANKIPRSTIRARWNAARVKNPNLPAFDITREVDAQTRTIIDPTSRAKPAQERTKSRAKKTPNDAQHLRAEVEPTRAQLAQFMEDFTRDIEQFSQPESAQDLSAKVAQEPRKIDAQEPAPEPAQTRATFDGHFLRTDGFLFVTLCAAMIGQMIHTAGFCYLNSPIKEWPTLRIIAAVVCAIGIDWTALVLTTRRGGWWYLIGFLLVHFAINIAFHLQIHEDWTWGEFCGFLLLSGVLAFSNFSYTDLFSRK